MTIINVSPNRLVQLGYEGEDRVTILRFGYSEKWLENGEGIFTVRVLRNGEKYYVGKVWLNSKCPEDAVFVYACPKILIKPDDVSDYRVIIH